MTAASVATKKPLSKKNIRKQDYQKASGPFISKQGGWLMKKMPADLSAERLVDQSGVSSSNLPFNSSYQVSQERKISISYINNCKKVR